MTQQELQSLGFVLEKTYEHDTYRTNRYSKGIMEVEFTYEGDELLTCDLTITDLNCLPITFDKIKAISEAIGDFE